MRAYTITDMRRRVDGEGRAQQTTASAYFQLSDVPQPAGMQPIPQNELSCTRSTSSNPFATHPGPGYGEEGAFSLHAWHTSDTAESTFRAHPLYTTAATCLPFLPVCLSGQGRARGTRSQPSRAGGGRALRCAAGRGTHRVESVHASGQRRPVKRGEAIVPTRGRNIHGPGGGQLLDFLCPKTLKGAGGGGPGRG